MITTGVGVLARPACMRPVPIALVLLVEELSWGEQLGGFAARDGLGEAEVWAFQVVPSEVAQQLQAEVGEIVEEEEIVVVVDTLFLHGAIEALAVGVHFGRLGKGVPMGNQMVGQGGGKVAQECAAVVGEHGLDGEREYGLNKAKELGSGGAGVAAGGPGPAEVRMQVGAHDDVTAIAQGAQFDAVQSDAMAGAFGPEMLEFTQAYGVHGLGFARPAVGVGDERILSGASAIRRPMVRALGQGRWRVAAMGCNRTCNFS